MASKHVEIRRCEPEDYQALAHILGQPKAVWGTLQVPYPSADTWRKRLAEPRDGVYSLVACASGEVIGSASVAMNIRSPRRRHAGELGVAVHDDWQRRGVGSALLGAIIDLADNWLDLSRLELTVYTDNVPAIGLYRRLGFEVEGTLRRYAFRGGVLVDAYVMARLR